MTIDHSSAIWGYGGTPATATIAGQQAGYRCGRKFPVAPSTAGSSVSIRPYAIPWTPTVDQWGIAFPAGLVGVVTTANLGTLTGNLNTDFETKWADLAGGSTMVAVPGILPVGYTVSDQTDWQSINANLTRLRTASGWIDKTWVPNTTPWGVFSFNTTFFSAAAIAAGTNITIRSGHPGWRNLGVQIGFSRGSTTGLPSAGSYRIRISHNADGSSGSSTGDLDTIDADYTWAAADCCESSDATTSQSKIANFTTAQASTIGTLSTFRMRVISNNLTGLLAGVPTLIESGICGFYESARVDIPYPVSVMGQGDLIAPGGYP